MSQSPPPPPPEDLEWEEWDSRTSPLSFPRHCLAGSFAGVAEHTLLYPLDTVKTCWQSQVLHKATAATATSSAASSSGCASSGSCKIFTTETLEKIIMPGSVGGNGTAYAGGDNGVNKSFQSTTSQPRNSSSSSTISSSKNQQGIWSTMKHLMQQGHHHSHYQPINQTLFTLAGNPPNVVDLTTATNAVTASFHRNNATSSSSSSSSSSPSSSTHKPIIVKRPWSKHGRILRNATLQDITAQGMIRASSSSVAAIMLHNPSSGHGSNTTTTTTTTSSSSAKASNHAGVRRLWRGVQTMFVGCIPAHALYFSSYELIKSVCTNGGGGYQHHPHQQQQQQYSSQHDTMAQVKKQKHPDQDQGHVGHDTLSPTQAMLAGGVATLLHDFVMTPMDTMKQRMQLGHYDNLRHAFISIVWGGGAVGGGDGVGSRGYGALSGGEGWKGLYRSFPITVMTNVPYGMIMMTTNEWLRGVLEDGLYGTHGHRYQQVEEKETNPFHFTTIMLSGMGAGAVASAVTAPLDRVKTRLQTQRMGMVLPSHYTISGPTSSPTTMTTSRKLTGHAGNANASVAIIMEERALAVAQGNPKVCPKMAMQDVTSTLFPSSAGTSSIHPSPLRPVQSFMATTTTTTPFQTYYSTPFEAFQSIVQEEGLRGLFRGTLPRVALHAPSVAISWTAYEMAKDWLIWSQQ